MHSGGGLGAWVAPDIGKQLISMWRLLFLISLTWVVVHFSDKFMMEAAYSHMKELTIVRDKNEELQTVIGKFLNN